MQKLRRVFHRKNVTGPTYKGRDSRLNRKNVNEYRLRSLVCAAARFTLKDDKRRAELTLCFCFSMLPSFERRHENEEIFKIILYCQTKLVAKNEQEKNNKKNNHEPVGYQKSCISLLLDVGRKAKNTKLLRFFTARSSATVFHNYQRKRRV